jgi:site-specific recombinase XerD
MTYIPIDIDKAVIRECKRRRYSEKTIKTYLYCINRFINWSGKTIDIISKKDVRLFLEKMSDKGLSGNSMNTYHMAIRFLFEDVLNKRIWIDIKYSKVPERIQKVLTKEEVRTLISNINNWKHKLMIELMYSSGLRVSELINLKAQDIILDKNYGFVRNGKGGKDRLFVLAKIVKEKLSNLVEIEKLEKEDYLFKTNRNNKYHMRSLQQIVKKAAKKAKLDYENIHCHTLRHSFATHLIENNYSVSDVQALLGHKSPETSLGYVHSSGKMINVKSPLDN